MATAQSQLEIVLRAKDDASKSIQALQKELDKLGSTSKTTQSSSSSLWSEIVKGQVVYNALQKAAGMAYDVLRQGIVDSIEEQKMLAQTQAKLASFGLAWDKVGESVTEFGNKMLKVGIDNEKAELAVAKLVKVSGGLEGSMKNVKLAADLASSGYGDFSSNIDNLQRILLGRGQRALVEYGIKMREGATIAEQLAAVQKKVSLSVEEYANTTEGQLKIVTQAFDEFRSSIGQGFLMAISGAIKQASGLGAEMATSEETMKSFAQAGYTAGQVLVVAFNLIKSAWSGIMVVIKTYFSAMYDQFGKTLDGIAFLAKGLEKVGIVSKEAVTSISATATGFKEEAGTLLAEVAQHAEDSTNALKNAGTAFADMGTGFDKAKKATDEANKSFGKVKDTLSGVDDSVSANSNKLQEFKNSLADFDQKYVETSKNGIEAVRNLQQESSSRLAEMAKSTADVTKQMSDLRTEFDKTSKTDARALAETFVQAETKVKDLKDSLAKATDVNTIQDIKNQIKEQESALSQTKDTQITFASDIAEARRRAGLTELQRAVEDYNEKRKLAEQEFNDKNASLQAELNAIAQKRLAEQTATAQKIAETQAETANKLLAIQVEKAQLIQKNKDEFAINTEYINSLNKAIADAQAYRLSVTADTAVKTNAILDSEIAKYNELSLAIQKAASFSVMGIMGGVPSSTVFGGVKGTREVGGSINTSGLYYLHQGEYVQSPYEAKSSSVVVNINGGTYLSQDVAEQMGDLIIDKLKSNMKL